MEGLGVAFCTESKPLPEAENYLLMPMSHGRTFASNSPLFTAGSSLAKRVISSWDTPPAGIIIPPPFCIQVWATKF